MYNYGRNIALKLRVSLLHLTQGERERHPDGGRVYSQESGRGGSF